MGLLFVLLSSCCSLLIAHFLKVSERAKSRVKHVLAINYLTASIVSFLISIGLGTSQINNPDWVILLAIFLGVLFIGNMFVYNISLSSAGMGISIATMRLSLIIPIGTSILVYNETINLTKSAGVFTVFISLYLLMPSISRAKNATLGSIIFPLLLFLVTGLIDSLLKVYEMELSLYISEYLFLSIIFFVSFLVATILIAIKREFDVKLREIFYGIIIGFANLYSSFFLLLALKELPGSIVFPLVNIGTVLAGTFIGIWVWKDRISTKQIIGLVISVISISLLIN